MQNLLPEFIQKRNVYMEEKELSNNLMEDVVETYLDGYISSAGACTCPQCRADIKAIILNTLAPRYVVATRSDALVRISAMSVQEQADVLAAVMKAVKIVSDSPRHS